MESLDDFVASLLASENLSVPTPVLEQMHADLYDRVEDTINKVILDNMPASALGEFEKALDSDDESASVTYCQKHIPNFDTLIGNALAKFKAAY